ncbi:limonene-1,2-epoxide hydrolase family protein [Novosphingobium sp.]|uniref:nuclear transport factor 2 family protein n=1 Tax=Novosphingobium sp. TaxID=1874826 RepID=UPI0025D1E537|nr:limonene-1,2-epoxide hydrolase family protein [Novosphingobium sp.]MCC6926806.1 nuclear transport factor 2 family protein [Novosphingobium sp.]
MATNAEVVRAFIAAWSRLDVEELVGYFTPDGTYYNMPIAPVSGHDALRPFITGFISGWASTEWEVLNLVESGDLVIAERVDRTVTPDGKQIELPCCGVFEMEQGKIRVWRDYFDMGTYMKALAG